MIKTGVELAASAKNVAENYKTLYVRGCFGWPLNEANQKRAIAAYAYNRRDSRKALIQAADEKTFAFDCVCLIKALLWGWNGDSSKGYGGAVYCSNGVPDRNADQMIQLCNRVSEDFSTIQVGEVVWLKGHIGIYIGNRMAVECTPSWKNGVQITAVKNLGEVDGYPARQWVCHGRLPYVAYDDSVFTVPLRMAQKGDRGVRIKALQGLLMVHGFDCGNSGADGIFGAATERALRAFQAKLGLEVDGIAGPESFRALLGVVNE